MTAWWDDRLYFGGRLCIRRSDNGELCIHIGYHNRLNIFLIRGRNIGWHRHLGVNPYFTIGWRGGYVEELAPETASWPVGSGERPGGPIVRHQVKAPYIRRIVGIHRVRTTKVGWRSVGFRWERPPD